MNNMKDFLDKLVTKYEEPSFISNDPIQFPHRFVQFTDIEVSAFLSSCLAYGKREKIIQSVQYIHELMEFKPAEFVLSFDYIKDKKIFDGFIHRYTSGDDIAILMHVIGSAMREFETMENLFMKDFDFSQKNVRFALINFVRELELFLPDGITSQRGFKFLLPSPVRGSACKRLNMSLRWLVRKGPVDLGLWQKVPERMLLIPLDTHVAKLSRLYHLTERKSDDWKTAEEITDRLREYNSDDPARYDFALFGMGVSKEIEPFS